MCTWVLESMAHCVSTAFEVMAGYRPALQWEPLEAVRLDRIPHDLVWHQSLHAMPGALWVKASPASYSAIGQRILQATGLESQDDAAIRTTYLEMLNRAMASFAEQVASRTHRNVTCALGEETREELPPLRGILARVPLPGNVHVEIVAGVTEELADALTADLHTAGAASPMPKTLDLLLDVELPVSVSFGRAQIALKDVLKLTTGSILELDRTIAEPVEIIVSNCTIARGEVVVVEGNFGVRVLQVISRQERLKTVS